MCLTVTLLECSDSVPCAACSASLELPVVLTGQLVARLDRTQAAQLYAGNVEYGYFVRGMEAKCQAAGMSQYTDASQLINMAASLTEQQLRFVSP